MGKPAMAPAQRNAKHEKHPQNLAGMIRDKDLGCPNDVCLAMEPGGRQRLWVTSPASYVPLPTGTGDSVHT